MQKNIILLLVVGLCVSWGPDNLSATDRQDTIPYKLAYIHTRNLNAGEAFLEGPIEPDNATVSEFQWIMSTLRNRCINPEGAIADIIMETWQMMKSMGYEEMSLLKVARTLTAVARNTKLFGNEKVNFRATTSYWLTQNKLKE